MYTFLLLFINNHTQQGFRIERVIFLGGGEIVLLPLRFGRSIRNIDFTEHRIYVLFFIKLSQTLISTLLRDWDCLLDIDYGAHEFTSDVLVVRVVCSFSVFCAQYLWIMLGHVILTFYNLLVILYWFITFGHVVVPSEFILYTNIIFVGIHLNTEYIVTGIEVLLFEHLQWK